MSLPPEHRLDVALDFSGLSEGYPLDAMVVVNSVGPPGGKATGVQLTWRIGRDVWDVDLDRLAVDRLVLLLAAAIEATIPP